MITKKSLSFEIDGNMINMDFRFPFQEDNFYALTEMYVVCSPDGNPDPNSETTLQLYKIPVPVFYPMLDMVTEVGGPVMFDIGVRIYATSKVPWRGFLPIKPSFTYRAISNTNPPGGISNPVWVGLTVVSYGVNDAFPY